MRLSRFPLSTLKETPADAEIVSHQLMLRCGMIRKQAAGVYSWLPLGLRVLRKVEKVVREEMDRAGALELLMPAVQPAELWQESGRWFEYGPELLRMNDRHERDFCFGPTHEEVITDSVRHDVTSYRQLTRLPDPDRSQVTLAELFAEVGRLASTDWPELGLELAASVQPQSLSVFADRQMIAQVPVSGATPYESGYLVSEFNAAPLLRGQHA